MIELVAQDSSQRLGLGKLPALVGQASESENFLQDAIPGKYNCLISRIDDRLIVWDLGGGMLVNGVRMAKATVGPGDTLRLGGVDFKVQHDHAPRRYVWGLRC
jgi:hypothetical protein